MAVEPREPRLAVRRVQPAYRQVADQLRGQILAGRLPPGERLPVESDLAALFGVSRSTVREALRSLASQNLITTSRGVGGGSSVAHPSPNHVSDYLEASLGLLAGAEEVTIDGLLEARALLEVPAAGLAAQRRSSRHLEVLAGALADLRSVELDDVIAQNRLFHTAVLEATGNQLLQVMTRPVFYVLTARLAHGAAPAAFWDRVAEEHRRVHAAVAAGDPEAAEREMSHHLEHLRTTYQRIDRAARAAAGAPRDDHDKEKA